MTGEINNEVEIDNKLSFMWNYLKFQLMREQCQISSFSSHRIFLKITNLQTQFGFFNNWVEAWNYLYNLI